MTNGEMMQKIFPDMEIEIGEIDAYVWINHEPSHFDKTWWNAEYKEPTTKNDLGVDAVSRQVAIDAVRRIHPVDTDYDCTLLDKDDVMYVLNDLPSVTSQESRWISVSEKLPNDRDWYLGIFKEPDTGWINPLPFICDYVGRETKATTKEFWILRGFTDMDEHIDYYFNLECVAWMPLPQNYGEVEE